MGGVGWALIRDWVLINFFYLQDGCLFEVDTNSRLGAYSNKYGFLVNGTWILDSILKWDLEFLGLNSQDS